MSGPLFLKLPTRTYLSNPKSKPNKNVATNAATSVLQNRTGDLQPSFSQLLNVDNSCFIDIDVESIDDTGQFN